MTGSTKDVGTDAVKGAAIGAPLGPYGAAAGGILGGLYGYFGGGESDAQQAADAAAAQHVSQEKQNAIALENYRQSARQQYHQLLLNRMAPYQGYSNVLAGMSGGQGMSTAGQSLAEDPLTLQQTGVGAPVGSNYAGWTDSSGPEGNTKEVHEGIGAYIDGTAHGEVVDNDPMKGYITPQGAQIKTTDYTAMVPGGGLDPTQAAYAPQAPYTPTANPTAGLQFAPRRA